MPKINLGAGEGGCWKVRGELQIMLLAGEAARTPFIFPLLKASAPSSLALPAAGRLLNQR